MKGAFTLCCKEIIHVGPSHWYPTRRTMTQQFIMEIDWNIKLWIKCVRLIEKNWRSFDIRCCQLFSKVSFHNYTSTYVLKGHELIITCSPKCLPMDRDVTLLDRPCHGVSAYWVVVFRLWLQVTNYKTIQYEIPTIHQQ